MLSFEATTTELVAERIAAMAGFADRIAGHGLARPLPLPPGGRPRRRRLLAEAGRAAWTSPPRSSSCASAGFAVDLPGCAAVRRRTRSTWSGARASSPAASPSAAPSSTRGSALRADAARRFVLDGRPVVVRDRVLGGVPELAAADEHVLAEDPLEARGERRESRPRALVQRVGLELDAHAAERARTRARGAGASPRR